MKLRLCKITLQLKCFKDTSQNFIRVKNYLRENIFYNEKIRKRTLKIVWYY